MNCVVSTVTSHEGVLDVSAKDGKREMRFLMPRQVLEWSEGQHFRCEVAETDNQKKEGVTLRGNVVARDAAATLLSFGGLPMRLPSSVVVGEGHEVVVRLVPYVAESRKRPLRRRPGGAAERGS